MRSRLTPRTLIDYRSPYCSRALFFVRSSARVLHEGGCARSSSRTIIVCTSSCFALIGPVACIRRGWLPVKRAYYQGRLEARHLAHQDTGVIRDRTHSAACFPPQKLIIVNSVKHATAHCGQSQMTEFAWALLLIHALPTGAT